MSYYIKYRGSLEEPTGWVSDNPCTCWKCGDDLDLDDDDCKKIVLRGENIVLCGLCHVCCESCEESLKDDVDGRNLIQFDGDIWHEKCFFRALAGQDCDGDPITDSLLTDDELLEEIRWEVYPLWTARCARILVNRARESNKWIRDWRRSNAEPTVDVFGGVA